MLATIRAFAILVASVLLLSLPAAARNVPGSSAEVQDKVDLDVASALTDLSVDSATSGAMYYFCDSGVRRNSEVSERDLRQDSCNWGLTVRGELINLSGDPDGYKYDSNIGLASILFSYQMTDQTKLVMGLIVEKGSTDTNYNLGEVEFTGFGGTVGVVHDISDAFRLSLLGSAEWLDYDVSRTNGLYSGSYDALRLTLDAALGGTIGDDELWAAYRSGLRYIRQNNDGYTEHVGGVPFAVVGSNDVESLLLVSNIRIGRTMESFTPFIEGSSNFAIIDTSGSALDETTWHGRAGIGFTAELAAGIFEMKSGIRLTEEGYAGYDAQIGFSMPF